MDSPLLRVTRFVERYSAAGLTDGAVRWNLFNRDHNGLVASGAVVQVGRVLFIDPARYFEWMRSSPRSAPRKRASKAHAAATEVR